MKGYNMPAAVANTESSQLAFADRLNAASGYFLDWRRTAVKLREGHNYTPEELAVRGAMLAFTAASAKYGSPYLEPTIGRPASLFVTAAIGFLIAHAVAVSHLIKARGEEKSKASNVKSEIFEGLDKTECNLSEANKLAIRTLAENIEAMVTPGEKAISTLHKSSEENGRIT